MNIKLLQNNFKFLNELITLNYGFNRTLALLFLFLCLGVNEVKGQIVSFPTTWSGSPSTVNASTVSANINSPVVCSRGSGLTASSSSSRFSSSGFPTSSTLTLASNSSFYTFTVTAASGYILNLNSSTLNFALGASGTGPIKYGIYTSVGGFSSTLNQIGTDLTNTSTSITFPNSGFNNLSSIEIRIYGWGGTSTSGTAGFSSLSLNGSVSSNSTPSLTSQTLTSALTSTFGTASTGVSTSATGSNLTNTITITPQTNYEVSTTSSTAGFSSSAITGVSSGTTFWVRLAANAAVGTYNSATAAVLSSTGATSVNVTTAASGNTVNPASPPTLTAASSPTVDGAFNVTFTDSSAWRSAITSITVGGTTLSNTAYTISAGQITFTPSASTLLQSSGSKSIAVIATNYSNATVTQSIGAGAATKLAITTQPTAPTINGGALAAQPVVVIQDQYSNTTTSTASVTAAVGSGTWTIGGTTSKAGVSGTATFTDLTATSVAAVTGATITFTSGSLTSVTSGTFTIPVPAPSNNLCSNPSAININGGTVSGTTIAATYTTLTSEPYTTYSDVWYSFTPSNSGNVTVSTATTNTDYDLYAFTSCPSSATSYVTGGNAATGSTTSESITFAVTSGTTYIIRVVNTTSSAGSTFTIQATQPVPTISSTGTLAAINTNYGTASSNTSFSVSGSNLAAGISINPPAGFQVSTSSTFASNIGTNGSPITLSPTSGTVSATTIYVRIPSTTAVGSYSGNIALTSTGATTVNVATVSSTVSAIAPTFGTFSAITKNYGDAPFTLTAPTSNSAGTITLTSANTSVATISGSTVTIVGAGTSTITATQAANGNYTSGTTTATLTVNTSAPTFGTFSAITKNYGDADFTLTAPISNSSGAITFTSNNTSVATISGSTVTIVGAGTSTITATQAANGNYSSGSTSATLTVNSNAPTFGTFSAITKNYGDADFTITAPISNSSGAITFTSSDTSVATISGSTVTIVGAGTSTITATQAANGNYSSGSTSAILTVNSNAPTFGTFSAITKNYGDADFTLTAPISNSSGAITFTSSNTSVATISGSTVTIVGAGTSTITATQAANSNYSSGSTTATLTVNTISPTLGSLSSITKNYGDTAFSITDPSSNSTGAFSYSSSNTSVVTISGSTVTIVGAGTATITATQAATSNYTSGSTSTTLTVNTISPTLGAFNSITKTIGDAAFSLTAPTSNSSGAFSYSSSNTSVATISGSTVTLVGVGLATITATQAATSNFTSGSTSTTLTVNTISPTIGTLNSITKTIGDANFSLTAPSSNSSGAFSYSSSDTSVATISGSTVTLVGVGTATITATQAANGNYSSGSTSATLTVNPVVPIISTTGTLNAFTSCSGFVSAEQSFSVSGVNLSSNITVTAPSGYELSLTSGGSFGNSVTLTQSAATVATTTVYVRLKNNASNGASGNIVCSSTNATSVNVSTGSATVGNPTVTNSNALNFDGINDKVTLNSNLLPATTELTYELWMKPNATSGVLLAHESWNTGYIHFQFHGSQIGFDVNGGNDNVFNYVFSSNTWYHIAAVYNSTAHTLKFYVNGVLQSTVVNNSFPSVVGNVPITIGSWNNDRYFSGNMDDIRIWNVARTDSQIQSAMNSELTGNESGLVAYFNFNQGTANGNNTAITSLTDNSGNNNSGSFSNMALTGTTSNFVLGVLSNNSISASGQTVCANSTATALTSNLNGVSGLTFQWYSNSTSSNSGGTLISNATSSSFTPPTNSAGTKYYYLVVTNTYGCVSSSNVSGAITVNPTPTITLASSATSAIYDANSQTTSISYSGTTGNPTDYSIIWNSSPSNSFMAVANANLPSSPISISVPAGANTGTYSGTLTVNNSYNCTSANNNFTFTIALNNGDTTPPTITHPVSQNSANAKSIKISENTAGITTYTANENVTWSISGGSESNLFNINPSTGLLTFINPPFYANPTDTAPTNSYVVEITATDGSANVSRQLLTVFISPFCGNWGN